MLNAIITLHQFKTATTIPKLIISSTVPTRDRGPEICTQICIYVTQGRSNINAHVHRVYLQKTSERERAIFAEAQFPSPTSIHTSRTKLNYLSLTCALPIPTKSSCHEYWWIEKEGWLPIDKRSLIRSISLA